MFSICDVHFSQKLVSLQASASASSECFCNHCQPACCKVKHQRKRKRAKGRDDVPPLPARYRAWKNKLVEVVSEVFHVDGGQIDDSLDKPTDCIVIVQISFEFFI